MNSFIRLFLAALNTVGSPSFFKWDTWLRASMLGVLVFLITGCVTPATPGITPSANSMQIKTQPSTTNTAISIPTTLDFPDVTVSRLVIETPDRNPCLDYFDRMRLHVEIINLGEQAAGEFTVEMNNAAQTVPAGLAPGKTIDLVFSEVPTLVRVVVDAGNQLVESNEENNLFINQLTQPPLPIQCLARPTSTPVAVGPIARLESQTNNDVKPKILDLAFSPNGRVLATGSTDNILRLWQIQGGIAPSANLLRTMQGHPFPVLSVAYSPSGTLLATGSSDHLVRLWRVSDGALLNTLQAHSDWVTHLSFSPDERFIASAGRDYTVRLWRTISERLQTTIDEGMSEITDIAFSPDRVSLAWSESNSMLRIYDLQHSRWFHILPPILEGSRPVAATSIAYAPDGSLLFAAYADGHLSAWDTTNGELIQEFPVFNGKITCLDISPNQHWLVFGTENGSIQLWYLNDLLDEPRRELVFQGHTAAINEVVFSPTGELIASASDDGSVLLWMVPQEQLP